MKDNNLFRYATSELSQDAFICWLVSHCQVSVYDETLPICQCAVDFLNTMLPDDKKWRKGADVQVKKQYLKIDVLLIIDGYHIIIEDKTFTDLHSNQISRYHDLLIEKGIDKKDITCVYYKMIEQSQKVEADIHLTRDIMLNIFRKYKSTITSDIFLDYFEHLEDIDQKVNSWKSIDYQHWEDLQYIGLFVNLCNEKLKDRPVWWGYSNNQSGGFMGLCFKDTLSPERLAELGITQDIGNYVYLHIDNNWKTGKIERRPEIAVKFSFEKIQFCDRDYSKINDFREKIYHYFRHHLWENPSFSVNPIQIGKSPTFMKICSIAYTPENCADLLMMMDELLRNLNFDLPPLLEISHHNLISENNVVGLHYSENPKDLEIYCRKLRKVTNPPQKTCNKCKYYASNMQGHGVECVWKDIGKEKSIVISHADRYDEMERVDKLIKRGILLKK